jgi:cytochrome P450
MDNSLTLPDHVAKERITDLDVWTVPPGFATPLDYLKSFRDAGVPSPFFTPHNDGHWFLFDYDSVLEALRDTDFFSNYPQGVPARPAGPPTLIPVELDPPEHTKYRNILGPAFSPVAMKRLQDRIRIRMRELIAKMAPRGSCDFAAEIASQLPTSIFLELMGMDLGDFDYIMSLERGFMHGETLEIRGEAGDGISTYVNRFIDKQADNPGDNLAGIMLKARDENGEPWSRQEIYNASFLLYVAGLDTVANMMSNVWYFLGTHRDALDYVAVHIGEADKFVDELMRLNEPAFVIKRVRRDGEWRGVQMRAGEAMLLAPMLANLDAQVFPEPEKFNPVRKNVRQQVTFGAGPHRCLGSHLARLEVLISLEEWFGQIPDFSIPAGADFHPHGGNVVGLGALPLIWKAV